jgi:hypothetical protein
MTIIEAMKLALEALLRSREAVKGDYDLASCAYGSVDPDGHRYQDAKKAVNCVKAAITALRTAIEQAEKQEAWKTSDTAYRPDGLPQDFTKHEVNSASDWSEWVCPDPEQYFMKCCDCGLVHEMQFNVVKYSAGDKCEDVDDPFVQAVFRARRHGKSADCLREMYVLFQHCENEMRYAGWDKREADNYVRNDLYEQIKNLLEKNT